MGAAACRLVSRRLCRRRPDHIGSPLGRFRSRGATAFAMIHGGRTTVLAAARRALDSGLAPRRGTLFTDSARFGRPYRFARLGPTGLGRSLLVTTPLAKLCRPISLGAGIGRSIHRPTAHTAPSSTAAARATLSARPLGGSCATATALAGIEVAARRRAALGSIVPLLLVATLGTALLLRLALTPRLAPS